MLNKKILNWFNSQRKKHKINIKIKGLNKLKKWRFNNEVIFHDSEGLPLMNSTFHKS